VLGLAGTIPYLGTSLVTLFCAWDVNFAAHHNGVGYLISPDTAFSMLEVLGPLQVGWGAVVRQVIFYLLPPSNVGTLDSVLFKCYPLGSRICRLRRLPLLQTLCHWRCRPCICMVDYYAYSRMGLSSPVSGFHHALLR
jgi:hypothetical protein